MRERERERETEKEKEITSEREREREGGRERGRGRGRGREGGQPSAARQKLHKTAPMQASPPLPEKVSSQLQSSHLLQSGKTLRICYCTNAIIFLHTCFNVTSKTNYHTNALILLGRPFAFIILVNIENPAKKCITPMIQYC